MSTVKSDPSGVILQYLADRDASAKIVFSRAGGSTFKMDVGEQTLEIASGIGCDEIVSVKNPGEAGFIVSYEQETQSLCVLSHEHQQISHRYRLITGRPHRLNRSVLCLPSVCFVGQDLSIKGCKRGACILWNGLEVSANAPLCSRVGDCVCTDYIPGHYFRMWLVCKDQEGDFTPLFQLEMKRHVCSWSQGKCTLQTVLCTPNSMIVLFKERGSGNQRSVSLYFLVYSGVLWMLMKGAHQINEIFYLRDMPKPKDVQLRGVFSTEDTAKTGILWDGILMRCQSCPSKGIDPHALEICDLKKGGGPLLELRYVPEDSGCARLQWRGLDGVFDECFLPANDS